MIAERKEIENTEREQEIVRASGVHNFVVTGFLPWPRPNSSFVSSTRLMRLYSEHECSGRQRDAPGLGYLYAFSSALSANEEAFT
jgi:hypothetical protein